ncbi:DctP family TRAP transporter solute-binding subunit [Salinicola peritrichatus]|uniref:DctP family TRAP transporter solute-binding subunit n=1 Tax=Salinicola peritrichatus TaxID=1267424 RepID=UPI000DA19C86|nr:DctP family TRAP transporter solute-binding subunit [Salinicola peritrichatus]
MSNIKTPALSALVSVMLLAGCDNQASENESAQNDASKSNDSSVTLSLAQAFPNKHPGGIYSDKFAKLINERTDGAVNINVHHNGVLGSEAEEIQQLQAGSLDLALLYGVSNFQNLNAKLGVEELPFIFESSEHARRAYDGEYGKAVSKILKDEGFEVLSYWENGMRHFTNNVRPIVDPEDMQGIKFRSAEVPIRLKMFEMLGASAIPMGFTELFTALQQGTVDGQENPIALIHANNFYEVQDYLSLSGHIYNSAVLTASPKAMAKLTPEQQKILRDTAEEMKVEERQMISEQNAELLADLKEKGMQVNSIDKQAFEKVVHPLWDSFAKENGDELIKLILKAKPSNAGNASAPQESTKAASVSHDAQAS